MTEILKLGDRVRGYDTFLFPWLGTVTSIVSKDIARVKWDNGWEYHYLNFNLVRVTPIEELARV